MTSNGYEIRFFGNARFTAKRDLFITYFKETCRCKKSIKLIVIWHMQQANTDPTDLWREFPYQWSAVHFVPGRCCSWHGSGTSDRAEGLECRTVYLPAPPCLLQSTRPYWRLVPPPRSVRSPDLRRRLAATTSGGSGSGKRRTLSVDLEVRKACLKFKEDAFLPNRTTLVAE